MKLEDQVCSLELAKRLKELGVKQNAIFEWVKCSTLNEWIWRLLQRDDDDHVNERISAFTVAELGEMLPIDTDSGKSRMNGTLFGCWMVCSEDGQTFWDDYVERDSDFQPQNFTAETEADARAKMLCYLIENKLVTP